jgi:hypothetical protein
VDLCGCVAVSDLKAQHLAHLSKEIKLDAVQPVIKKAKRSIAELSAATTAAQTVTQEKRKKKKKKKKMGFSSHEHSKGFECLSKSIG